MLVLIYICKLTHSVDHRIHSQYIEISAFLTRVIENQRAFRIKILEYAMPLRFFFWLFAENCRVILAQHNHQRFYSHCIFFHISQIQARRNSENTKDYRVTWESVLQIFLASKAIFHNGAECQFISLALAHVGV